VSSKSSETSLLGESGSGLGNSGEWTLQEAEGLCYAELVQWNSFRELLVRFGAMSVKQEIGEDELQSHSQTDQQVEQASDAIVTSNKVLKLLEAKVPYGSSLVAVACGAECFYLS